MAFEDALCGSTAADPSRPKIGLVLGAGAARGWSHIGALQALDRSGFRPDVICGCSSGSLVAASYACGKLDRLAEFATSLTWRRMLGFFDLSWRGGGLIEGRWLVDFFANILENAAIEELPITYGAVATDLYSGRETWLTKGPLIDAIRASVAMPGLLTPIRHRGRWLVDGALVNPLPVSLCRALGADVIVGVSPGGDLVTTIPARGPEAVALEPIGTNGKSGATAMSAAGKSPSPTAAETTADASMEVAPPSRSVEPAVTPLAPTGETEASSADAPMAIAGAKTAAPEPRESAGTDVEPAPEMSADAAPESAAVAVDAAAMIDGRETGDAQRPDDLPETAPAAQASWFAWMSAGATRRAPPPPPPPEEPRPSYVDVLGHTFVASQNFVARVRLAADPVDLMIAPDVSGIGIMDFHRGAEAIAAGEAAVAEKHDALQKIWPGG